MLCVDKVRATCANYTRFVPSYNVAKIEKVEASCFTLIKLLYPSVSIIHITCVTCKGTVYLRFTDHSFKEGQRRKLLLSGRNMISH